MLVEIINTYEITEENVELIQNVGKINFIDNNSFIEIMTACVKQLLVIYGFRKQHFLNRKW